MSIYNIIKKEIRLNGLKGGLIKLFLLDSRARFIILFRFLNITKEKKNIFLKILRLYYINLGRSFGTEIPFNVSVGLNLYLPHPYGIIIHPKVQIGNNCTILQQVTIGNPSVKKINDVPKIYNNVIISSGAKIIGKIIIKNSCIIGANSVINKSFDESSVIVGVPGKKIKK